MATSFEAAFTTAAPASRAPWTGRRVRALRVPDGSMTDEGLREGDYLLIDPGAAATTGSIVLAQVDGALTVKRLSREADGRLRLRPANPEMLPLLVTPGHTRVLGIVVGILRRSGFAASRVRTPGGPRPGPATASPTLELSLHTLWQAMRAAEVETVRRRGRRRERLREIARGLRTLRDCYLVTEVPRLRAALLREAGGLIHQLRRFGIEPSASVAPESESLRSVRGPDRVLAFPS
jgi:hypothetical protein